MFNLDFCCVFLFSTIVLPKSEGSDNVRLREAGEAGKVTVRTVLCRRTFQKPVKRSISPSGQEEANWMSLMNVVKPHCYHLL
ncbi:hypothetical protein, partial [Phocaeicola vulgatus]|uniref:hypothetical protein n=1 Tax=Phocaeicola vulgatus TaxID=821 RepID=UPI001E575B97